MGIFKEKIYQLEDWARQQVQIYPDAADYGIIATDDIKAQMKEILQTLPEVIVSDKINSRSQVCRRYRSTVWWDIEDGTLVDIGYVKDYIRRVEFFSINLRNVHQDYDIDPRTF